MAPESSISLCPPLHYKYTRTETWCFQHPQVGVFLTVLQMGKTDKLWLIQGHLELEDTDAHLCVHSSVHWCEPIASHSCPTRWVRSDFDLNSSAFAWRQKVWVIWNPYQSFPSFFIFLSTSGGLEKKIRSHKRWHFVWWWISGLVTLLTVYVNLVEMYYIARMHTECTAVFTCQQLILYIRNFHTAGTNQAHCT